MIEILDDHVDVSRLVLDLNQFLTTNDLWDKIQVSLTSIAGNNDWDCSTGSMLDLNRPERFYSTMNSALSGTYIADLLKKYKSFYRWRLLKVMPGCTYSVHQDTFPGKINKRIHIPVITNPHSYFCFYDAEPVDAGISTVKFYHLKPGTVYELNTSHYHTAVNYGETARYHIVGVRYEDIK
jgi:hypothetical protein